MTAILLILVAVVLWRAGLNGLLRWTGILGLGLGALVVFGVDAGQGIPLVVAGSLVWALGKVIDPARPGRYAL